jgi:hypothetical protein
MKRRKRQNRRSEQFVIDEDEERWFIDIDESSSFSVNHLLSITHHDESVIEKVLEFTSLFRHEIYASNDENP